MYKIQIEFTTGWQFVEQVSFEGCSLQRFRDEDSIRVRDRLDGSITFYGSAYESLEAETAIQLNCKLYLDNDQIYSGKIQLRGEWHERSKKCMLAVELQDEYTTLLRNLDIEHDYGYPRFNTQLTTKVYVTVRNAFQMRAVTLSGGVNTPHETDLWKHCSSGNKGIIEEWHHQKEFFQTDYKLIASNGHDGYMSLPENITVQFCWKLDPGFIKKYYACKKYSIGNTPPVGTSNDYWQEVGDDFLFPNAYTMGQRFAPFKFNDAIYSETDKEWQRRGCDGSLETTGFSAPKLYNYLADMLDRADPTIQISFAGFFPYLDVTNPTYKNLAVYNNEFQDLNDQYQPPPSKYKLSDLIGIYMTIFDCDWRLENGEFVFRHPSEIPATPAPSQTYQFINSVFNKDWSVETFNSDLSNNVYRESFTIGTSELKDFEKQLLDYDNNAVEKFDYTNTNFEIDFSLVISEPDNQSRICILKYNSNGEVPSDFDIITGDFFYNIDMFLSKLVKLFFTHGRPFNEGILSGVTFGNPETLQLFLDYLWNNEIPIPYNDQRLLDFDYLIVTSFGNLKVDQLSINLASQSAIITAAKS